MFTIDLLVIFYAWITTYILQFIAAPLLARWTKDKLIDSGWAIGRTAGWLTVALIIWFFSHLRLPLNTGIGLWLVVITLSTLSFSLLKRHFSSLLATFKTHRIFIIIEEILFFLGFAGLSLVRTFNPKILDLEKFMDAGFMASYLRASTLPAPDIWLAGETINYYSFGHFLGSIITRFWHLPIALSYNLLLGFIMGLSLMISFSIVVNLLHRTLKPVSTRSLYLGGIIGSLLTVLGGNTHTIWYLLKNKNWQGYWYADATRFIETTIHEFPSYSFVVSDLHAHVWSLPFVLTFLLVTLIWVSDLFAHPPRFPNISLRRISLTHLRATLITTINKPASHFYSSAALGILIGTFVMTSAWDALIYPILLCLLALLLVISFPQILFKLLFSALTVVIIAGLTALPWLLHFTSISEGIALVPARSPIWQLFALWTNHVTLSALAIIFIIIISLSLKDLSRQASLLLVAALVFTAWTMLALPEIIYVKDIYTGHPRANTMFKLTYQGFILMSLVGGWVAGALTSKQYLNRFIRLISAILVALILTANLTFPYFAYRDYYGRFNDYQGLDGYSWLKDESPDDFAGIQWLQKHVSGQPVILEAVGESYTKYDRVSAVTGLPTVLGWRVHEWLWRGGFDIPGQRTEEIKTMFEQPLSTEARRLYDHYQVEYIFIGDREYEAYPNLSLTQLQTLGDTVFEQNRTFIIHRSFSPK